MIFKNDMEVFNAKSCLFYDLEMPKMDTTTRANLAPISNTFFFVPERQSKFSVSKMSKIGRIVPNLVLVEYLSD